MADEERIARLARHIGEDVRREQHLLFTDGEVLEFRRQGAAQLHAICADFAASINRLLTPPVLEMVPPAFAPEMFRNSAANLIQSMRKGGSCRLRLNRREKDFRPTNS